MVIGLFKGMFLSMLTHYIITWIVYDVFDLGFKYTFSAISAVIALFPVCSSWMFNLPTIF